MLLLVTILSLVGCTSNVVTNDYLDNKAYKNLVWPDIRPSPYDALLAWDGPWSDSCITELNSIEVLVVNNSAIDELCGDNYIAKDSYVRVGCFIYYTHPLRIIIDEDSNRVYVESHELVHWLFHCSGIGTANDDHNSKLFLPTLIRINKILWKKK